MSPSVPDDSARQIPTHRIRLRRPWVRNVHSNKSGSLIESDRVDVPDTTSNQPKDNPPVNGGTNVVQVTYTRSFNAPSGIEIGDRVFVEFVPAEFGGSVFLNESQLTQPSGDGWFEITKLLAASNSLAVRLNDDRYTARLAAEVNLQIVSGG